MDEQDAGIGSGMNELKLIYSLFDQEVRHTLGFLASLDERDWQAISHPWDSILFHRLANNVTVEEIIKHIVMFEHYVISCVKSKEHGAVLSIEGDETLCESVPSEKDIVTCYREIHKENLGTIVSFRQSDLDKKFTFIDQPYTGIGLLWMLTGHHAFHLGQLRSMTLPVING